MATAAAQSLPLVSGAHRCTLSPFRPYRHYPTGASWEMTATLGRKLSVSSTRSSTRFAALPFDLSPPPIDHDLLETVTLEGAKVSDDGVIETFDNDDEALDAVDNGVVVVDLSHFGRIRVGGDDRIQFLHNQSTANFECLHEGQA